MKAWFNTNSMDLLPVNMASSTKTGINRFTVFEKSTAQIVSCIKHKNTDRRCA